MVVEGCDETGVPDDSRMGNGVVIVDLEVIVSVFLMVKVLSLADK